jgi:hypothetical protein
MPTTVEDVARQVIAAIDSDAGYLLASRWVAHRYQQLCSRSRFRHLRHVGTLEIHPALTQGTVSVTQGSPIVTTTDPAALAEWRAVDKDIPGRWFRGRTIWYEIIDAQIGINSATLTLNSAYTEQSGNPSLVPYHIVERYSRLDPKVRWLSDYMVLQNRNIALAYLPLAELDVTHPRRIVVSAFGPMTWSEVAVDEQQRRVIEFYPFNKNYQTIGYVYWTEPPFLKEKDYIPMDIDPYILREGALIDAMRYKASRAAEEGNSEMAAFWSNSYRAQSTAWERNIIEAIRTDRGVDDITLILRTSRDRRPTFPRDVVSGRDEIFVRGGRP